jgi:hypothetical protein
MQLYVGSTVRYIQLYNPLSFEADLDISIIA